MCCVRSRSGGCPYEVGAGHTRLRAVGGTPLLQSSPKFISKYLAALVMEADPVVERSESRRTGLDVQKAAMFGDQVVRLVQEIPDKGDVEDWHVRPPSLSIRRRRAPSKRDAVRPSVAALAYCSCSTWVPPQCARLRTNSVLLQRSSTNDNTWSVGRVAPIIASFAGADGAGQGREAPRWSEGSLDARRRFRILACRSDARRWLQKRTMSSTWAALGVTKCVPANVERKL